MKKIRSTRLPRLIAPLACLLAAWATSAQAQTLYNAAESSLGATAKGSNAKFNKDWPAQNTLNEGRRSGTIFDPFEGATIDIRLVIPVDIEAIEVGGLNNYDMKFPNGVDVYIEGEKVASSKLPDSAGVVRIPAKGFGQNIRLVATGSHPRRTKKDGKIGPDYGGFKVIRVLTPTDISKKMELPSAYQTETVPNSIESTLATKGSVDVFIEVRKTQGHPNTFWDKEDIQAYRKMIGTSQLLQEQLAALKRAMDERMAKDLGVPAPEKDKDGNWLHLPESQVGKIHNQNALDIVNLATVYVLTGDAKYGEYAKKMLVAYGEAFPDYAPGNRPGFNHDSGKLFDQRLSDATWLIQVARGYDLVHGLPSMTSSERKVIEKDLLRASADFIAQNSSTLRNPTNWSAICTTAVLVTGYAIDAPDLVELAMYGPRGSKDNPTGGVMMHFGEKSISPDGMWSEGAMGYQGMAMQALVMDAEVLRHHGIDMYSHRDAAFKGLFDSPLEFSYPDLTAPAIHDSSRVSIVGSEAYLWEYGYLRYRDPKYLTIINQTGKRLGAQFQQFSTSVLYDESIIDDPEPVEWASVNLFDVGYGILRNTTQDGTVSLLLDYGPNRSHGHPDKLSIDLYAFNNWLIPDPGAVWYEEPLYKNWYHTTMAHNTLSVDELSQMACDGKQLVYGFGEHIGIQRANTDKAYAGVMIDRSVFLTPNYMADIFGAFAELPRTLDLCWHIRGEYSSDLTTQPFAFKAPAERGYNELINVRSTSLDGAYNADFTVEGGRARFLAAGGDATQVILGEGWLGLERPTTILQRRQTNQTLYGNVVEFDYDDKAFVKSVAIAGSLKEGYGILTVETAEGVDYCFASYRPGTYTTEHLKTDGLQSYVSYLGDTPSTLFLGGGTTLESKGVMLQRSEPGLALLESAPNGGYVLANPSPTAASIKVKQPALASLKAFALDATGKRTGQAVKLSQSQGAIVVQLDANERVEFAPADAPNLYDHRKAVLAKVQAEQEALLRKAFEECEVRTKARLADAKKHPVPANTTIVVQAEDLSGQGGGEVNITSKKMAAIGDSFSGWNNSGHWLEYTVDAPAEGYYNLSFVYASKMSNAERLLYVNGSDPEPFVALNFASTGGWSNSSDDWQLLQLINPTNEKPLLIKLNKGPNQIRMTNSNGVGTNLDYLLITSPDVAVKRIDPAAKS